MPHPAAYGDASEIRVGDVVYAEGSSAILGDVVDIDEDGIKVVWRKTETVEQPEDLVLAPGNPHEGQV